MEAETGVQVQLGRSPWSEHDAALGTDNGVPARAAVGGAIARDIEAKSIEAHAGGAAQPLCPARRVLDIGRDAGF